MPRTVVHEVRLVQVDPRANHNKFYICTLDDAGTLTKRWGRVGAATGQTKVEPNSTRWDLERAVAAKENRGYTRVEAIDVPSAPDARPATNTAVLAAAAKASLVTTSNKTLDALIERIVAANKHAITLASGGQITFTATGQATTALGAVSAASVARARTILDEIVTAGPQDPRRPARVAEYLTLVPQKVPAKRGWDANFAADARSQAKQYELLDALTAVVPATTAVDAPAVQFRYKVAVADAETTKQIATKFDADRNAMHVDVAAQKVKRVFVLTDTATGDVAARQTAVFKTRNIKTMWHGTRTHNVLNILRAGLVLAGTGTVTMESGAMFGRGIYASLESTKASRYSAGLWGVGGRERGSSYVFLADFAMGLEVRPTSASQHTLVGTKDPATGKTYASINVKPGTCGVRNHEAIVKDPARVRLRYLVELA